MILFWLAIGVVTAVLAHSRGRNGFAWLGIGLLFPCLGPILVLVLPDLAAQASREEAQQREQERLQESLRLERQRSASFRRHARQRLDAHDAALGLDTGREDEAVSLPETAAPEPVPVAEVWFLAEPGGAPEGPMDADGLVARAAELGPERVLVWREGMAGWVPFLHRPPPAE